MNKFLDFIIATQLSTACAFICAILAHLVAIHANDNWQFAVYVCLVCSIVFMLAPYVIFMNLENKRVH